RLVSPVTNVSCSGSKSGVKNHDGFLAEVIVCECELCSCQDTVMLLDGENNGCHRGFGDVGFEEKDGFLGEGKSLMIYVTTEKSIIHLSIALVERQMKGRNTTNERKGLFSVYIGSITAVYMQGMVVELDEKVVLLVTDHQLPMPHSLRVGAIMEGLVQKYCSSCLPLSHGILSEYCLHDICGCGKEINCDPSKQVVPISNLISQCENMFLKSLNASGTEFDKNHQYGIIVWGGIYHDQPIRKILKSEDMNIVLLASLKISDYCGRLQLIDATDSIDVVIPDLPSV
ncbi:conserved telomere maintenance component 1, partial [Tanacetum coccineum]